MRDIAEVLGRFLRFTPKVLAKDKQRVSVGLCRIEPLINPFFFKYEGRRNDSDE